MTALKIYIKFCSRMQLSLGQSASPLPTYENVHEAVDNNHSLRNSKSFGRFEEYHKIIKKCHKINYDWSHFIFKSLSNIIPNLLLLFNSFFFTSPPFPHTPLVLVQLLYEQQTTKDRKFVSLFVLWFWFFKGALPPKAIIQIWTPLYAAKKIRKAPLLKWLTQQTNEIK